MVRRYIFEGENIGKISRGEMFQPQPTIDLKHFTYTLPCATSASKFLGGVNAQYFLKLCTYMVCRLTITFIDP